ncbi:MAG: OPT/YSL family transporter, partial [Planctomycetales bacterium]|nr:OPT/YSL family transporter [Planctomycetales bacterium]
MNETDDNLQRMYTPAPNEAQLTARAIIAGCLVGSIVSCTNIYIGLKIGWTFGASIISAVLGFSFFAIIGRRLSVLETNIAQTAGSSAGYMSSAAGLVAAIPAMNLLGFEIPWYSLCLWALSVGFLGVFFAVPLRRQYVEIDKLRFPTGTATAETIMAMFGEAAEAIAKSRVLIAAGIGAGCFTLGSHFFPFVESPPLDEWLESTAIGGFLALAAAWSFKVYLGPSLFGAGFLIGPRVVLSLVLGAILSWAVLGPIAQWQGWTTTEIMNYNGGVRGWILWPGVALMVSEALSSLAFSWKTFIRVFQVKTLSDGSTDPERIPNSWWIGGLIAGTCLTCVVAKFLFDIPVHFTVIAVALSSVLSAVATRSLGETDINPVGGMGKVTQLVFGGLSPGNMATNLMTAGITSAGASQAADMMQDLKTGHMLGASPRKQFIAQMSGILAGVVFAIPAYTLFTSAYKLGGDELPAPAAMAWKAMAEVLANGFDSLPPHATTAVGIAMICGVVITILRRIDSIKDYVPSGLAMGIAFIIPAYYSLVMLYGLIVWFIWK